MSKQSTGVNSVLGLVCVAGLIGCASVPGQYEVDTSASSAALSTEGRSVEADQTASQATASPVVKSTDDYRKIRTAKALEGLRFEDGLVVVDAKAAPSLLASPKAMSSQEVFKAMPEMRAHNDFTGALAAYRWAILQDPDNAKAYEGLGDALIAKRKDDKALAAYRTAVALSPKDVGMRMKLAETINRNGDVQGWADELANVLALDPDNGQAHARMAVAKHYLGDDQGARKEMALAEQLGGDVPGALKAILSK